MKQINLLTMLLFVSVALSAQNYYIAHRGASYFAPENTLASVKKAWELGADAAEIDIHLSADNRVMVIHDANTKRTSMGKSQLEIAGSTSEELRKIDVGTFKSEAFAGEKIPFIEEILQTIPEGKTLVIEIKCGPEVLPTLQKAINESGKINQLVFISFGWETILETQKVFGNNQCYYLKMLPFGLNRKMKLAAQNGLAGVNLYHGIVNKRVIKKAEKLDIEVLAWTVDDVKTAKKLNKLGVQKITTNRPKWLKDQLENN